MEKNNNNENKLEYKTKWLKCTHTRPTGLKWVPPSLHDRMFLTCETTVSWTQQDDGWGDAGHARDAKNATQGWSAPSWDHDYSMSHPLLRLLPGMMTISSSSRTSGMMAISSSSLLNLLCLLFLTLLVLDSFVVLTRLTSPDCMKTIRKPHK